jgi:hypothetical protein
MKKFLILTTILLSSPAFAQQTAYRPFVYETYCKLETGGNVYDDTCKVIETREKGGALRTRNIFSNRFKLTIKGRFDKQQGYMTWDSHNKREYKWDYRVNDEGWTYVMPGVLMESISWD